jgi:hypothetical protein
MTVEALDALIDDLAAGAPYSEILSHGTLAIVRQRIPADRAVGSIDTDTSAMPARIAAASPDGDG